MLGQCVRAHVVKTLGSTDEAGFTYPLNFATIYDTPQTEYVYIMGIDHAVSNFDGRIIAVLETDKIDTDKKRIWIMAPKSTRYINLDIIEALDLENNYKDYKLTCLFESSSGAIVYRNIRGSIHFLLIKNKRSNNWGFPKGHLEKGETRADAARREVLEETGIHVKIQLGFEAVSKYKIRDKIDKKVSIFVGTTDDKETKIQKSEIESYIWLPYFKALHHLNFENDKIILMKANRFLINRGILPADHHLNDYKKNKSYIKKQKELEEKRKQKQQFYKNKNKNNNKKSNNNKKYDNQQNSIKSNNNVTINS